MVDARFAGKDVPEPEFAEDAGQPWPGVADALLNYSGDSATKYEVVNALRGARLLVPVKAVLDSVETAESGHSVEKDSSMATVTIERPDGQRGLLAFTSQLAMQRWNSDCRPLAASAQRVAMAAFQEEADVVVVDVNGPVTFVLERPALVAVARDMPWISPAEDGEVREAVFEALGEVSGSDRFDFEIHEGSDGADLRVVAIVRQGDEAPTADEIVAILTDAAERMQQVQILALKLPNGIEFGVWSE